MHEASDTVAQPAGIHADTSPSICTARGVQFVAFAPSGSPYAFFHGFALRISIPACRTFAPMAAADRFHAGVQRFSSSRSFIMQKFIRRFIQDESGATAIEYALIAALIAVGLVASLDGVRTALVATFTSIVNALS